MTRLSREILNLIETPRDELSKSEEMRRKLFTSALEIADFLKANRPDIEENQIWAAATHLLVQPNEDAYLKAIGFTKRPIRLDTLLRESRFNVPRIHPEGGLKRRQRFTFIDLFAGIGGFNIALSRAGGKCIFASEWDNAARLTYAMNFGKVPFGDIRQLTRRGGIPLSSAAVRRNIPPSDVLAAGFPCQPFSQAGVASRNFHGHSHGLKCETQGTLFEDILIIARATHPKILLLENVSNLARHDGGRTLEVIVTEIQNSGYTIFPERDRDSNSNWAVIDSRSVVAQRRKRVYMVCVRNDLARLKGGLKFPTFKLPSTDFPLSEILESDQSMSNEEKFATYSISERLWKSHQAREEGHRNKGNGFRIGLVSDLSRPAPTLVARYYKDGKDCLIPNLDDPTKPPRTLTPRECALLQTFPRDFWIPNSKTPAFRQFGNSITVDVAARIAKSISNFYFN